MRNVERNVQKPEAFLRELTGMINSFYNLFELCREEELPPVVNGCIRYFEEMGKDCHQVSSQYRRPFEFLNSLLDMVRVTFDPRPLGSLLLNANPQFIYSAIPRTPFRLGYLSMIVEPDDKPDLRWYNKLTDRLLELGYSLDGISKGFLVVASARADYYALPLLNTVFRPGFSVDEVIQMIRSEVHGERSEVAKDVYIGFVSDESLRDQVRISMWLIFPAEEI